MDPFQPRDTLFFPFLHLGFQVCFKITLSIDYIIELGYNENERNKMKKMIVISVILFLIINAFAATFSNEEINGILLMGEEEKLARDAYLELYDLNFL